ncbi:MAG: hypothetical protein FJ138_14990 [Deltaproteobacteria bacterium]|nr:hypothetical protein [Deltaproteobacteria bacterium]
MTPHVPRALPLTALLALTALLPLSACGPSTADDSNPPLPSPPEAGATAGTAAGAAAGASAPAEVTDCAALNDPAAVTCFANDDCPDGRRCQDVGPRDLPTPCCVPGARGATPAGEPCAPEEGELECASALCIVQDDPAAGLCSGVCASDTDCPPALPRCLSVAFSGSALMFCSPAAP